MHTSRDERIIDDVLRGDADAYGVLVLEYQRPIYNLMLRLTGCRAEAADLTQDTFVRAYERLEQFKAGRRFFPWLYAIGMNMARDWARKNRPEVLDENMDRHGEDAGNNDVLDQERLLALKQDKAALNKALGELNLEQREAIILHYRDGLAMKEIAGIFNVSVSGAKMRVHRGVQHLRQILSENGHV